MTKLFYTAIASMTLAMPAGASFSITMNYTDVSIPNQSIFDAAVDFWEMAITGYADGGTRVVTINADTFSQAASGGGVTLGSARPNAIFFAANHIVTSLGTASFNIHPDAVGGSGLLNELTIRHEMGHILGIGTLWSSSGVGFPGFQELYDEGTGQYTGANALTAYNREFGQNGLFIPVELDGGPGTANGHWNEVLDNFSTENSPGFDADPGDGEAAPTVVSGINAGLSMDDALMTGVLSGSGFLSDTTLGSLQDLGYTTIDFNVSPIPEPSSTVLIALGSFALILRRRK